MGERWKAFTEKHPDIMAFAEKLGKDNVGFLASALAWTLLTSIVPIVVGLVAISGLFLRNPSTQQAVEDHLSAALQGVLNAKDIQSLVSVSINHTGLLGIIAFVGLMWGGSNIGGALSTVFQPIFQVRGRDFLREKLIDVGMIFIFTVLMVVIIAATTAPALLDRLFVGVQMPGIVAFAIGTLVTLLAAFLLFAVIYLVFPNTEPRFKLENIWLGAGVAAIMFQIVTFVFPLYVRFSHFQRYGAVLLPILLLTAWIYFLSVIIVVGAEFVAFDALREARRQREPIGPTPDGTVPQHAQVSRTSTSQS